jgi:hypothetical protein
MSPAQGPSSCAQISFSQFNRGSCAAAGNKLCGAATIEIERATWAGDHVSSAVRDICEEFIQWASRRIADLVPAESAWATVRMFGSDVMIAYGRDRAEHDRRTDCGTGALQSSEQLELLMSLPIGWPVPVRSLSYREQRLLRRLPKGIVHVAGGAVERLAVSPVKVELAIIRAANWQSGLERAGRFAPFTARMMWLPRLPLDTGVLLREASDYGIGVLTGSADKAEVVAAPPRFVRRRFTTAGWLFTEQVYAHLQ